MAVPNLPMAVSDAAGISLPYHLPAIRPNLKAVSVAPCIIFITHKTEESHVYWCHSKLECLKVQTEVLTKTVENSQHPSCIFNFSGVGLNIAVIKCAP